VLEPGLEATIEDRVTASMTAEALGSGDLPVLGTPMVLALAERAACAALAGRLDDGTTSVGTWAELSHVAPTRVGAEVRGVARLTGVDRRTLVFEFAISDEAGEVARGTHRRVIVERERFLRTAEER
jgi:predicted thioesterase